MRKEEFYVICDNCFREAKVIGREDSVNGWSKERIPYDNFRNFVVDFCSEQCKVNWNDKHLLSKD